MPEAKKISVKSDARLDLEMLNYFQEEWKYRHSHYWSLTTKCFVLVLITTLLPSITSAFGVSFNVKQFPEWIFPIAGFIISLISFIILKSESERLTVVGEAKYSVNKKLHCSYHYKDVGRNKKKISKNLTLFILAFEIILESLVLYLMLIKN